MIGKISGNGSVCMQRLGMLTGHCVQGLLGLFPGWLVGICHHLAYLSVYICATILGANLIRMRRKIPEFIHGDMNS